MYTLSTDKKTCCSRRASRRKLHPIHQPYDWRGSQHDYILAAKNRRLLRRPDGRLMRNLHCGFVQADEIWCYVGKKDKRLREAIRRSWEANGCSWRWTEERSWCLSIQSASAPRKRVVLHQRTSGAHQIDQNISYPRTDSIL